MKTKSVREIAVIDIQEYLDSQPKEEARFNCSADGYETERWYITIGDIFTKEAARLNRQLGIHNINYFKK